MSTAEAKTPSKSLITKSEFETRLANVRARMARAGFDCLIVTDPCNIYYLTGYDGWSLYTPQAVLVFADHDPVIIARSMDVLGIRMTTWFSDEQLIGYAEDLVQTPDAHPFEVVARELAARFGNARLRAAIESDSYYLSVRAIDTLKDRLPNAVFPDSGLLINWVRFVKSKSELGLLRQAGQLLTHSMLQRVPTNATLSPLPMPPTFQALKISEAAIPAAPPLCWPMRE